LRVDDSGDAVIGDALSNGIERKGGAVQRLVAA
jgi:hypothetical protein